MTKTNLKLAEPPPPSPERQRHAEQLALVAGLAAAVAGLKDDHARLRDELLTVMAKVRRHREERAVRENALAVIEHARNTDVRLVTANQAMTLADSAREARRRLAALPVATAEGSQAAEADGLAVIRLEGEELALVDEIAKAEMRLSFARDGLNATKEAVALGDPNVNALAVARAAAWVRFCDLNAAAAAVVGARLLPLPEPEAAALMFAALVRETMEKLDRDAAAEFPAVA